VGKVLGWAAWPRATWSVCETWLHESDFASDHEGALKWHRRMTLRLAKLSCGPLVTLGNRVGMFDPMTGIFVNRQCSSGLAAA
jgi:hypothetical protein